MINLLISFADVKIELNFLNTNFTMATARNVLCLSEIPIENIFPKNRLYQIDTINDEIRIQFRHHINNFKNELKQIKITKDKVTRPSKHDTMNQPGQNSRKKQYFYRLKQEFPAIFDLKVIQKMNWIFSMNRDFFHPIYDSLREIIDDQETVKQIMKYNSLTKQPNLYDYDSSDS